ncbi:MAG: PAS domain S-box protein [Elusimicrobia bacterium]|nr:PAS domain S-box protein [Elusimicrobiota bacterium]
MGKARPEAQDIPIPGRIIQTLLMAAFSQDNFDPFLKKIAAILAAPGAIGAGAEVTIAVRGTGSQLSTAVARSSGKRLPFSGGNTCALAAPITLAGKTAGRIGVSLPCRPGDRAAAKNILETAARIISARIANERRDRELYMERDLSDSVKHVEELYLAFPSISIQEISRAVLDEARRLTGSRLGFTGRIDASGRRLDVDSITLESWEGKPPPRPLTFGQPSGLWGRVIKNRKPLMTNSAGGQAGGSGLPAGHPGIERFLGVPAMSGRKLLGLLALANPPEDYSAADLNIARKLARVYAMILERKDSEERQKEEDSRFKAIVSSTRDVIYTVNLAGRITYISPTTEDYGYRPEELVGRCVTDLAHPEDRDFITKALANAVKTGHTLPIIPYRVRKKDGSYAYVAQKSGIVMKDGSIAYFTGVVRDVTEQRKTEILLKESEALMRMVFDTAKDAIFVKDMNGMYMKANKACAELMKTTPEEMIGRSDSDYFQAKTAAAIFQTDSEVVRTGRTLSLNNLHPFPAGSRYVNIIKTPLRNAAGETVGLLGVARDITELKKMESELALARAAEAVSSVARPMAHDFNNALAAINGYATLIDEDLPESSPLKKEISRIIEAVGRAAELTSRFQDFARNPKIDGHGESGEKKEEKK